METAEKMPLQGFPIGIAEAIDLPDNNGYIKASPNFFRNRKVEPEVPAQVEEPHVVARVEQQPDVPPAHAEEPVPSLVEKPITAQVWRKHRSESLSCSEYLEAIQEYGGRT
ncbi:hypothetical protein K1719_009380 [Acacia pycnantha]|nr:hypothetical protein K1719_009380 [Acacia pycnantha]